jgi:cell fate (sporulation/competence/biofilm development) regulator YlbF (YheA/YmcA/DUF963 family)
MLSGMNECCHSLPCKETIEGLCRALLEQPDLKRARAAVEAFAANEQATGVYRDLVELRNELHHRQFNGQKPSPEEIARYESLRKQFLDMPEALPFVEAQQEISKVQETVAQYVGLTFQLGRVPREEDLEQEGCCGGSGGGGGCGCHHEH